ncbi:MAG: hypothetical protein IT378_25150, partial [Sandaracinaceae bacterium]|nr:hypothetical protein [Sandaracinaceae bacterium]
MAAFASLPFDEQLARIDALARSGEDPQSILHDAIGLPDVEPLACLLDALAGAGRPLPDLRPMAGALGDASLARLYTRDSHPQVSSLLEALADEILLAWPPERIGAIAFVMRWLRRRAPDRHEALVARAQSALDEPGADARWLLFVPGARLEALARDRAWKPRIDTLVALAIDALARAPKSISQANAERLLAQRVYADPGHFFFELLQNADDAGAKRWAASVERERVVVRHDGAPFSLLDLVGVLSIGQTTKRAEQIGFFGVGFKSVYEICERPRVSSGALDFEIAHVTIPSALAPAPREPGETVRVLPYARALDVALLHERALALPPEILLTLPHVEALEVRGPSGEHQRWQEEHDGSTSILRSSDGRAKRYHLATRTLGFVGEREEGRARESPVLVAIELGEGGPTPAGGPTVYAFLPTAERSGLRVLVHARFDVTLDRERLELGSSWNDALLREAGLALAQAIAELAEARARVLEVIASPEELAPGMAPLAASLASALRDVPCLPGAAAELLPPSRSRLLEPALARALAGVDLAGARALEPLGARERSVALSLGARTFDLQDIVSWLGETLREGEPPPSWLGAAVYDALAEAGAPAIRALPLLLDGAGALVSAGRARSAPATWVALYAGERSLVSLAWLATLPPALAGKLGLEPFDPGALTRDLVNPILRDRLLGRGGLLFEALADLDAHALEPLADLPLWPTTLGLHASLQDGVVRLDPELAPLADQLPDLQLDARFAAAHPALVDRVVPAFGLRQLADRLAAGLTLERPAVLVSLLDAVAASLPRALAGRFAGLPLFADRHGEPRALSGDARAWLPSEPALASILPSWPWLEHAGAFVLSLELARADARTVAASLLSEAALPRVPREALERVLAWLGAHAGELSSATADALSRAPIWLDAEGTPRVLGALRRGTASPALDAFYGARGGRFIASTSTLALARALGLDARLPASDFGAAIGDLLRDEGAQGVARELVARVVNEASAVLHPHELA